MSSYNCTKPGNLFVGYEKLREDILRGFLNGNSFAILGGRRCGKTSILMQIENDIIEKGLISFSPLSRRFSMQECGTPLTPNILFEKFYNLIVQDIQADSWRDGILGREYDNFLRHLDSASSLLNKYYGDKWLVILLIDEMDNAISKLPNDQFFHNLRHFLMESKYRHRFRIIATGVQDMAQLIYSGGSPLNNLLHKYLGILTLEQAKLLVSFGFRQMYDETQELELLFELTGRHPYLLQGILEKLYEDKTNWTEALILEAVDEFLKEHDDFQRWFDKFQPEQKEVYKCLADNQFNKMTRLEIKSKIETSLQSKVKEAISILSYHGVIEDISKNEIKISGTMFRDWFLEQTNFIPLNKKIMENNFENILDIIPEQQTTEKIRIFFISALPNGMQVPRFSSEKEFLENLINKQYNDKYLFINNINMQYINIVSEIKNKQPEILHFSVHGKKADSKSNLFFVDKAGNEKRIEKSDLQSKLNALYTENFLAKHFKLVLFNACESNLIAKDLSKLEFVDYAIGSSLQVEDKLALDFSEKFYEEYFISNIIEDSFKIARATLTKKDIYHLYKKGKEIK